MEIQESLKESGNTQHDNRSIISNKIKNVEEEIVKSQIKMNEHIQLEKKLNIPLRNFKLESNDTENKRYQVGKKVNAIVTQK